MPASSLFVVPNGVHHNLAGAVALVKAFLGQIDVDEVEWNEILAEVEHG
jgi:hypothetical protein